MSHLYHLQWQLIVACMALQKVVKGLQYTATLRSDCICGKEEIAYNTMPDSDTGLFVNK